MFPHCFAEPSFPSPVFWTLDFGLDWKCQVVSLTVAITVVHDSGSKDRGVWNTWHSGDNVHKVCSIMFCISPLTVLSKSGIISLNIKQLKFLKYIQAENTISTCTVTVCQIPWMYPTTTPRSCTIVKQLSRTEQSPPLSQGSQTLKMWLANEWTSVTMTCWS